MTRAQKFQDLDHYTADHIHDAMALNDPDELALVSVTVALTARELGPAQDLCLALCGHGNPTVRGNAIASLGHLARRFRALDQVRVQPVIEAALTDAEEYVLQHTQSAADEIHQFLGWNIKGHTYGIP